MKWIKASEKLPMMEIVLFIREHTNGQKRLGNFYRNDEDGVWIFIQSNGLHESFDVHQDSEAFSNYEWLDESICPELSQSELKAVKTAESILKECLRMVTTEHFKEGHYQVIEMAMQEYANQFSQPKEGVDPVEWIDVEKELPKQDGWYIVYSSHYEYATSEVFKGGNWDANNEYVDSISHWRPMPEPPKI